MTHVLDKASIESREGKAGGYHGGQAPVKSWEKLIVLSALIICVGCAAAPTAPPAPAAPLPTSAQVGTTTIVAVQAAGRRRVASKRCPSSSESPSAKTLSWEGCIVFSAGLLKV